MVLPLFDLAGVRLCVAVHPVQTQVVLAVGCYELFLFFCVFKQGKALSRGAFGTLLLSLVGEIVVQAFVGLRVDAGFLLVFLPLPFAFALGLAAGFAFGVVGAAEAARFPMAALARWPRHAKAAIPTLCWIGARAKVNESGHYSMVFRVIPT